MTSAPVSVVIPLYNAARLVPQAVQSVLAQTRIPAEIIVVDDGSTDDPARALTRFGDRVRYLCQANQGVSTARNQGVRLAGQEFVAFLDADDVWHPFKLQLQMELFQRRPELQMVGGQQFPWPSARFPAIDLDGAYPVSDVNWSDLVVKNRLSTSAIVARRTALLDAGLFDPSIQGPEDRDLWMRVVEAGPVANIDLPLMGYRDVPGSVSKQVDRCRRGMLRILQKQDERHKWAGRWLLRRKAYSYVHHTCTEILAAGGQHRSAMLSSVRSLLWYPLPYRSAEVSTRAERLKRLAVNLLRAVHLKAPYRPRTADFDGSGPDALQTLLLQPAN